MVGKAGLFFKVYQRIFYDNCEKEFTLSRAWYVGQVLFSIVFGYWSVTSSSIYALAQYWRVSNFHAIAVLDGSFVRLE